MLNDLKGRRIVLGIALVLMAVSEPSHAAKPQPRTLDCTRQDDAKRGFTPRAYTLTRIYVREKAPEYSFLKGQWILGDPIETLAPNTCLHIVKREEVGVIQIWYLVRYKDAGGQIQSGWVWGGTANKDEGQYIGGQTQPLVEGQRFLDAPSVLSAWLPFVSVAYAQGDTLPPVPSSSNDGATMLPKRPAADMSVYLVRIPVLGAVNVGSISATILFVIMLCGMVAKAVWDQTDKGDTLWPPKGKIVRPLLVSPIAFSAFWGPMYVQQGSAGLSLTMALYAFQIGFMWQHVLEKRISSGRSDGT